MQSEQSDSICKQKAHGCLDIANNGSMREEPQLVLSVFHYRQSFALMPRTHVPEDEHEAPFFIIHVPASSLSVCTLNADSTAYQVVTMSSSAFPHALAYRLIMSVIKSNQYHSD